MRSCNLSISAGTEGIWYRLKVNTRIQTYVKFRLRCSGGVSKYKLLIDMNASNDQLSKTAVCDSQLGASEIVQEKVKLLYRVDQQVKLLDLQAEAELLLKQLQALKQQKSEQTVSSVS